MRLKQHALVGLISVCSACAGELSGRLVLTRKITKKTVAPVTYNVRGAVVTGAPAATSTEYARMVLVLEGKQNERPEPRSAVLNQRGVAGTRDNVFGVQWVTSIHSISGAFR